MKRTFTILFFTLLFAALAALGLVACGDKVLSPTENAFLGIWETTVAEQDGTEVRIIWEFRSLYGDDKTVWCEIRSGDRIVSRRKGEWKVVSEDLLRVVLDSAYVGVTERDEGDPGGANDEDGWGGFIGAILGEIVLGLTDDEYAIEYAWDGEVLQLKWYDGRFHDYVRTG